MKTQDFIAKNKENNDGVQRTCSSVFTTGDGKFYSYGYHYPLLIRVTKGNHTAYFLNDKGYSVTTGKHIRWASASADYRYNSKYGDSIPLAVSNEINELKAAIPLLTARATRKRVTLSERLAELMTAQNWLNAYSL